MSFRRLIQILQEVEADIAIDDPAEIRVVKTWPLGPDDTLPLNDFPCVMNWPEGQSDGRFGGTMNDITHIVRVQFFYGLAGRADGGDVALALYDAARRMFDRERQADWRLGTDEAHLMDITTDGPPVGTIPWASVDGRGYTGSQMLLHFSVIDRRPLADG